MLVDINLLPEKIKEKATFLWIAIGILLVALISWIVLYSLAKSNNEEVLVQQQTAYELQRQQEVITSQLRLSAFGQEKEQLAATVEFLEGYQYETHPLIEELANLLPDRGFFQELTFTSPNEVLLNVQFDDLMEPAHYLTRMKASSLVIDATVQEIETEKLEDMDARENILPRYFATYFIQFVDDRALPGEDAVIDPDAIEQPEEEVPAEEAPPEEPSEEQPPPAEDTEGGDTVE